MCSKYLIKNSTELIINMQLWKIFNQNPSGKKLTKSLQNSYMRLAHKIMTQKRMTLGQVILTATDFAVQITYPTVLQAMPDQIVLVCDMILNRPLINYW